jgi:hypothetical protein
MRKKKKRCFIEIYRYLKTVNEKLNIQRQEKKKNRVYNIKEKQIDDHDKNDVIMYFVDNILLQ